MDVVTRMLTQIVARSLSRVAIILIFTTSLVKIHSWAYQDQINIHKAQSFELSLLPQPCHNLLILRIVTNQIKCFITCDHGSVGKAFLNRCNQELQRLLLVAVGSVGPCKVKVRAGSIRIDRSEER